MARRVDLIGDDIDEKPKRPKPPERELDEDVEYDLSLKEIHRGVSVTWLMQAFSMDRTTVRKKLAKLDPIASERGNAEIYNFRQACAYLVKPKVDIHEYMKSMKPTELPVELQKDYWDARAKRQKYELNAGMLWRTTDVQEVFGEAFKHIKTSVQLFISTIERTSEMTPAQRKTLENLCDGMLVDLHQRLVSMKDSKRTASSLESDNEIDDV